MFGTLECEGGEGGHARRDIPLIPDLISTLGTKYIHTRIHTLGDCLIDKKTDRQTDRQNEGDE